ncbi:hypothetical protein KC332_g11944 [Hortaea werneckii]|uniref:Heme haloperoxidase family profile domain-containing protein n=1 Tax=Hortaea werneckii EXF-2000 TaxID=1157616 RepID=A0A1Z5SNV8_HORWE|nr:hypothetical protein KC358_g11957 [Hortaea werneckii]OTA22499.1 hypothetical protein BTJ68_14879 [Hortaea werneckii EXF-2000]KAI6813885.1 hypothetical protein KC350_g11462 [Hortaea werneckii]KAI6915036.1 hypothetical protein KC348_g12131 [Hortaea werneckii]KAI6928298.1 hypothetical protein KC341_g11621 [Hortaea werneckii]
MKATPTLTLGLPALAAAYPGIMGLHNRQAAEDMLQKMHEREAAPAPEADPQLLSGGILDTVTDTVSSVVNDVQGLLGSVAAAVDQENLRPEPGFEFQPPGPGDSRGPCPGLNLLANYGYLPRNGHVNYGQVLEATARGFNMGADLTTVLAVFAILTDGDIATQSWYLGSDPNVEGGGLNRHDTVECDISPNREDYYLGCGDNHHLSSRMFEQNVRFAAADGSKEFTLDVMGSQYKANSELSQERNPYLWYFPFPSIVSLGAFAFYPNFFANGTYGAGGVANYESISTIIGAQLNEETGHYEYVPERWPENWYRRSTPYGAVDALTDGFLNIYPRNPVPMPIAQLGTDNFNVQTVLCDVYSGINSIVPLALADDYESVSAEVTWALGKLADVGITADLLGCPDNSQTDYLYANATQPGGPQNPPPVDEQTWQSDNVYGKTYFCEKPTAPVCAHTC